MALGHYVRLMPPAYLKPYVKRHKNDATDAEAICGAVLRPNMRFVPVKSPEQQAGLKLHRTRHLFIRQRTATINTIRAFLDEFGVVAPVGRKGLDEWLKLIAGGKDSRVPPTAANMSCGLEHSARRPSRADPHPRSAHSCLATDQ
jgi:transposase